jgi:glycosyltransferase involved in cell wall biosynthesis
VSPAVAGSLVTAIIFSKDRALQLDGLLRSLMEHVIELDDAAIHVLHAASNARHQAQYSRLASEYPAVDWVAESDFKPDLLRIASGSSHLLFLVDDAVFTGTVNMAQMVALLAEHPSALGYSLRLGKNTTYCYPFARKQRLPRLSAVAPGVVAYKWGKADLDFGYPLEVSSSLYRSSDVLPLLERMEYRSPNSLEAALATMASRFRRSRPGLLCGNRSTTFCMPVNMVQGEIDNRSGSSPTLTSEALADAFEQGQRLSFEDYDGFIPHACHQEVPIRLRPREERAPTVSVVIPCYRQAQTLPAAVESILAQTFTDWEIVVVDDGSPDDVDAAVTALKAAHPGRRIHLHRQPNQGVAAARNSGISVATGRMILPLDADDEIAPTMLERTVEYARGHPEVDIVTTDLIRFGAAQGVVRLPVFDRDLVCAMNILNYCSLFRVGLWTAVGGYSSAMDLGYEDWDFWLSCAERGARVGHVAEALFRYRVQASSRDTVARANHQRLRSLVRARHPALFSLRERALRRVRSNRARLWRRLGVRVPLSSGG